MPSHRLFQFLILVLLLSACSIPQPTQTDLNPQANYWQQVGTVLDVHLNQNADSPSLALDSSGNPVVSWEEEIVSGSYHFIYAKRWNGTSWTQLGRRVARYLDLFHPTYRPSLAVDNSDNPVVVWDQLESQYYMYMARWNGTDFDSSGTGEILNSSASILAVNASLALDDSGQAVVGLVEQTPSGTEQRVYVKRSNGASWLPLGGGPVNININLNASNPSVALDSADNPVVSWQECTSSTCSNTSLYVKRWTGSSWLQLGNILDIVPSSKVSNSSVAIDSSGNPVVSWQEFDGTSTNIYVKRWTGGSWLQLGTLLDANINRNADSPSIAVDSSGNPVVAWHESDGTSSNIYIKRWDGSSWVLIGNILDINTSRDASNPSLALDSSGNPVVAWHESDGTSTNIYVKKYVTNSWENMGNSLDIVAGQSATNSSIARKSNNNPAVAWDETDSTNGSKNVYVKEWNGASWRTRGGALDKVLGADAENPSIAFRAIGTNIHVAWQESGNIYEKLWDGTTWVTQGSPNSGAIDNNLASEAITPSLAIRTDNFPVVAFAEDGNIIVKRLSEIFWIPIGAGFLDTTLANEAYKPSLALKSDDNPVVAWYEDNGTSFDIFVKEFTGSAWEPLGGAIDKTVSKDAKDIVLAIRTDDKPVVAWEEDGNIYVKRWTGTSWASVGGVLDKTASNEALRPVIDLRSDNNPVVSWQEWNGSSYDVWAKRWTGSTWTTVSTNALDKSLAKNAERPALVLKTDNNPIISWDEDDGLSENVFVRRF